MSHPSFNFQKGHSFLCVHRPYRLPIYSIYSYIISAQAWRDLRELADSRLVVQGPSISFMRELVKAASNIRKVTDMHIRYYRFMKGECVIRIREWLDRFVAGLYLLSLSYQNDCYYTMQSTWGIIPWNNTAAIYLHVRHSFWINWNRWVQQFLFLCSSYRLGWKYS